MRTTREQLNKTMGRFTRGIAGASAQHPWRTMTSWVLVLGVVFFLAASGGGTFTDDFSSAGSQSARAMELLNENFPDATKGTALVVFEAQDGTTLDDQRDHVAEVLRGVDALDHVASVADPFEAGTISRDGRIGYAAMTLDIPEREMGKPAFTVLSYAVSGADVAGLRVELGGDAVFLNAEDSSSGHVGIGRLARRHRPAKAAEDTAWWRFGHRVCARPGRTCSPRSACSWPSRPRCSGCRPRSRPLATLPLRPPTDRRTTYSLKASVLG